MKTRANVKAGGTRYQHNESLKVRTSIKSGKLSANHNGKLSKNRR